MKKKHGEKIGISTAANQDYDGYGKGYGSSAAVKGRKVFFRLVCKGHAGFDPQGRVSRYRIITLLKMIQKVKSDVQKMCQS